MLKYDWVLKKFKKFCDASGGDVQELYDAVREVMSDGLKTRFAVDVLEFCPMLVDLEELNKEVIECEDMDLCIRLLKQNWVYGNNVEKVLQKVALYGGEEDCYEALRCLGLDSRCDTLKNVKTNTLNGQKIMRHISVMDDRVLCSKNAEYNFYLATMLSNCDLAKSIDKNGHIDMVIQSGDGEYMSSILRFGGWLDIEDHKINEIVDILCDKKYSSKNKFDALLALENCKGKQYVNFTKLYQSLIEKGNPFYIFALNKSSKYSKKKKDAFAYVDAKRKESDEINLVSNKNEEVKDKKDDELSR